MKDNIDLHLLDKRIKILKNLTVFFAVLTPLPLLGIGLEFPYSYCFVALSVLFLIATVTFAVLMHKTEKLIKRTVAYLKDARDNIVAANNALSAYLADTYNNINFKELGDSGYVNFARENLIFSSEGKFTIEKDFNGVEGTHLALQIRGTKIVSKPTDYDDVLDYETYLFTLNVGYFENCPFTEENDSGLILPQEDIIGKSIRFSSNGGYVCNLDSVETDDVERGELLISEMTEESMIISFKCLVECGAADVLYGKIKLIRDPQNSDEIYVL